MIWRRCYVLKNSTSPLGGFFAPQNVKKSPLWGDLLKVVRFCWKFALWVIWWCWIHFWCSFDPKKILWPLPRGVFDPKTPFLAEKWPFVPISLKRASDFDDFFTDVRCYYYFLLSLLLLLLLFLKLWDWPLLFLCVFSIWPPPRDLSIGRLFIFIILFVIIIAIIFLQLWDIWPPPRDLSIVRLIILECYLNW